MAKSPRSTVKVRRLPQKGDEVTLRATVTRTSEGDRQTVTLRIKGHDYPITIPADYLHNDE